MAANTPQSRKAKGRNLQKQIVKMFEEQFPELEGNLFSRSMGASGTDVYFSRDFENRFPYSIEAKCQESINIWESLEQAKANASLISPIPLLIFKRAHSDIYVTLPFTNFLQIIKDT